MARAQARRDPLYDRLLKLPASLRALEARLNVHLERDFDRDLLQRAGLVTSGVSRHNRLVERHSTPFGAYWRSYDFASSAGRGNLLLFPLGPKFAGNRFDDQAFEQAGGEVIFHLPNGLQGYMLADAKDRRLDVAAPVAIVRDPDETAGTPEVVNGATHDVASTVSIDGLSMFAFRDDKADANEHVIIKAGTAGDILGWFRDARKSSAFLVADLPRDHARAALLKDPAKIGALTVTFAAAWEKGDQRPKDEEGTRQATEIIPGAPVEAPYETVRRQIGGFRAAVTVRYDKR